MARHALQFISKLTLEKINNETVIAHSPYTPFLLARNLLWQPFKLGFVLRCRYPCRLVEDPVEILVYSIEQKAQELLRVVLI